MNYLYPVKEEYPGESSPSQRSGDPSSLIVAPPQPMEGLSDASPPPFLNKTYDMVDDSSTNRVVSWSRGGGSFVVWNPHSFVMNLLPRYFKHNNFSSFVRQLNTYVSGLDSLTPKQLKLGFRKVDPDRWEFANEGFLRGQKHLLKNIRRRKTPSSQPIQPHQALGPCVEVGRFGLDGEVDRLRRDKQVLMMELVKLRQQQQSTRAYLQAMEQRLQGTEMKQQQMMAFLARAMQNPAFVQQLVQHKEKRKELEDTVTKKRRRPIDQGPSGFGGGETILRGKGISHVKAEPLEYGAGEYAMSELEALAMEMQGYGKATKEPEEEAEPPEICDKELDEVFWDELFSERYEGELSMPRAEIGDDEDVIILADRLGYLGSSPK